MFRRRATYEIRGFAVVRGRRRRSFFALAAACLGSAASAGIVALPPAARADYKVTAGRPPSAADRVVRVPAGSSVDIELGGRGSPRQSLIFLLRNAPAHGDLGEVRSTGRDTALVTYRHRGDPTVGKAGSDSFTYAVRAEGNAVSAAATVRIEIVEAAPRVVLGGLNGSGGAMSGEKESEPRLLDFGAVTIGQVARRELTIGNAGGGVATGTLEPMAPWEIEAAAGAQSGTYSYRLARGDRQRVSLIFRPAVARHFEGTLRFGAAAATGISGENVVQLIGTGLPEPAPSPSIPVAVVLEAEPSPPSKPATAARAGTDEGSGNKTTIRSQEASAAVPAPPPVRSIAVESAASTNVAAVGNRLSILGLELLGADKRTLTIGWTYPNTPPRVTSPWPVRYRAELQRVRREPATTAGGGSAELEVDWVPHENTTWSSQGGESGGAQTWRGTLHGLPAGATQIVRVVGLDENGNAFPPSPFLIAATRPSARPLGWLTWRKVAIAALALGAGLLWRQRRAGLRT